jgi:hypothetical protein
LVRRFVTHTACVGAFVGWDGISLLSGARGAVFNLVEGKDTDLIEAKISQYKMQNEDQIASNQAKQVRLRFGRREAVLGCVCVHSASGCTAESSRVESGAWWWHCAYPRCRLAKPVTCASDAC